MKKKKTLQSNYIQIPLFLSSSVAAAGPFVENSEKDGGLGWN